MIPYSNDENISIIFSKANTYICVAVHAQTLDLVHDLLFLFLLHGSRHCRICGFGGVYLFGLRPDAVEEVIESLAIRLGVTIWSRHFLDILWF